MKDSKREQQNKQLQEELQKSQAVISQMAREHGIGVGDVIRKMTKFLNIPHCSRCEKNQRLLNHLRIRRWRISWENIKDL